MTVIDDPTTSTLVRNYTELAPFDAVIGVLCNSGRTAQEIAELIGHPLRAVVNTLNYLAVDPFEVAQADTLHHFALPAFARRVVPNRPDGEAMAARWVRS